MITYSTNMMGPWSMDWYRQRGLTRKATRVVQENSVLVKNGRHKVGDVLEYDEITTHYGGGRIDIRGLDDSEFYNGWGEYSLPIMHGEDFNALSDWLDEQEDEVVRTYDELICDFEREYGKLIRWAENG
jgi:hypothetical protein